MLGSPHTKSVGISMALLPAAFLQEIHFHVFPIDCLYFYRLVGAGGARGTIALPDFDYKVNPSQPGRIDYAPSYY